VSPVNKSEHGLSRRNYWRSLEQLENSPEFQRWAQAEFPEGLSEVISPVTRRSFLSLMGASMALAGLSGCIRRPEEHILPYSKAPEDIIPGIPNFYATAYPHSGFGVGVVVESHEGRPTKIEGNPQHPFSLGATDVFTQASVLNLYDPDRLTSYVSGGQAITRSAFVDQLRSKVSELKTRQGAGLRFLSGLSTSPTLEALSAQLSQSLPQAVWHTYEPVSLENAVAGGHLAFGQAVIPTYQLDKADVILALDCDFMGTEPGSVLYGRQWSRRRGNDGASTPTNRLYAVEGIFSITGAMADHRLRLPSSHVDGFIRALGAQLSSQGLSLPSELQMALEPHRTHPFDARWVSALSAELLAARGKSVIMVGSAQPASVHALAHALNASLENVGQSVQYSPAPIGVASVANPDTGLTGLVAALRQNQVETLVILGGNPGYDAPADLELATLIKNVPTSIRLGSHQDETALACKLVVPQSHYLEMWSDVRALDGTASIVQPLIEPLYDSMSELELLSHFVDGASNRGYELVRAQWQTALGTLDFEKRWRRMLHEGVIADVAAPPVQVVLNGASIGAGLAQKEMPQLSLQNLELRFVTDARVFDGRFANNGWLQELPDPMTKLTWDNAALISPRTARELAVKRGDMVSLKYRDRTLEMPVWPMPGMADYVVAVSLGYGRTHSGRIGTGTGFNAYLLRDSSAPYFDAGLVSTRTGGTHLLATSQEHGSMENRPLVLEATVDEYQKNPRFAQEAVEHPPLRSVFTEHEYVGQQWGMTINLNVCTGCSTCVVACQAENNIPVVGKERVLRGREMHWIRIDRYFAGDEETAEAVQQPMMCQQCQNAPCEPVCPVAATVHSRDGGLNDMVYNRCIGTRYCSNNCPFKVRRFNFFNYHEDFTEIEKMQQNPDVTVRMRGVMEKCTYCLQRINSARRQMKLSGAARIPDGTITPACAQACPVDAIVFGDVNDPESRVSRLKARDMNYALLAELNVKPRTSYLARLRNPNPELG